MDSNSGKYNNKTLDMIFEDGVEAKYNESVLYAGKAEYSNSAGFLTISEEVKIKMKVVLYLQTNYYLI